MLWKSVFEQMTGEDLLGALKIITGTMHQKEKLESDLMKMVFLKDESGCDMGLIEDGGNAKGSLHNTS